MNEIYDLNENEQKDQEAKDVNLSLDVDQSWSDEARMKEAELNHDLAMSQLDFDREKYYNSIPKSDKEIELMYAYKNRLLDKKIADEAYRRSPAYKKEQYTITGLVIAGLVALGKWMWDMMNGGK